MPQDININKMTNLLKEKNNKIFEKYKELKHNKLNNGQEEKELYDQYKAHFQKKKDDMKIQIKVLESIIKHLDNMKKSKKDKKDILQDIKREQGKVFDEIKNIKKELEKIESIER